MTESAERVCSGCGDSEETVRLEQCHICNRWFCAECAHRAGFGRKFCSAECARAYYFTGDPDDDEDGESED
jgi:hypothetical protein